MRNRGVALGLLLVGSGLAGCQLPRASHDGVRSPASTSPGTSPSTSTSRARRASGPVDVLLHRGAGPVTVGGTSAGTVTLARAGELLRGDRGRELASPVWLAPANPSRGVTFAGRAYAGGIEVRVRGAELDVRNRVDLEDYVAGVLAAELVLWSARPAELEAQAIAARSYAVAALESRGGPTRSPYLFGDVRDQAYRGAPALNDDTRDFAARVAAAVQRTRGRVLSEKGRVVDARFHAACGGATADGRAIFPELRFGCMRSVTCAPCTEQAQRSTGGTWSVTTPRTALDATARELGLGPELQALEPAERDASGRWLSARLRGSSGSRDVPFERVRAALDPRAVESARIVRTWPHAGQPIEGGLYLEGRGRGHGVGLCQTGAKGYAAAGWSAERILAHYYVGAVVVDGG